MKKSLLPAVVFLIAAIVACYFMFKRPTTDWAFVQRTIGFEFPAGTEYLAQYDNREWLVVSVVRLPGDALAFASSHRFIMATSQEIGSAEFLPAGYRDVPRGANVLCAVGQTDYEAWVAVLDPATHLLWIEINYPHPGGTHPGTAMQLAPHR